MRDHEDILPRVSDHDVADHRKRPGEHGDARLATVGSEGERVGFPRLVFPAEALLDVTTREAFPSAMADFPERRLRVGGTP